MSLEDPLKTENSVDETGDLTILGKKIKHDDFEHLMSFYEADHKLTIDERQIMSKDLTNSGLTAMLWALLDSSIVVTAPLVYRRFQEKKLGAPLPKPARLPTFFRSIFFSMAGLGVYFWSSSYHSKTNQQYRIANLEADCTSGKFSEEEVESKQRLLNTWKALDPSKLSLFTVYYFKTASDPSLAMKSPKDMVSSDPHAVMYVPPPQGIDKPLPGVFRTVQEHEKSKSHWEKIREENGFVRAKNEELSSSSSETSSTSSDGIQLVEDSLTDSIESKAETEASVPLSAWERLRKGN